MRPIPRPLLPLAIGFAIGIAAESLLESPPGPWALAAIVSLLAGGLTAWRCAALFRPAAVLLFVCLGGHAMAVALWEYPPDHLHRLSEDWLDMPVALEGWVAQPPDPRPPETRDIPDPGRLRFVAEVTRLRLGGNWVPTTGRARLTLWEPAPSLAYGDEVRGVFRLRHPRRFDNPGSFDYPAYLATQSVFLEGWTREPVEIVAAARGSRLLAGVFALRERILRRLDATLPVAQAALLKAAVLGDRSGLSPEMNQAFLDSGTYHILAISGL
ncbi:MAG TPA: ComEC/Rec2 family competence protein, partial [Candidatus Sulfotelmatobacter sp.]|nr:ComEC/Rec2 family competence protein [Candidatus Sulfotelmatobacter sp.]